MGSDTWRKRNRFACRLRFLSLIIHALIAPNLISQTLTIFASDNIQILLSDSLGRKVGYDSKTGRVHREFPDCGYFLSGVGDIDIPVGEQTDEQAYELYVKGELHGNLILTVFGEQDGRYTIRVSRSGKPRLQRITKTGLILRDSIQSFTLGLSRQGVGSLTKNVNEGILLQDLDVCLKLRLIKNRGLYTSLRQKAENAIRQHDKGQDHSAVNLLQAFLNEVKAQTEKGIDKDAAAILTEDAQALIQQWKK